MGRTLENSMAEKEANDIAFKFMNSNDVVKDMSEAYNVDFSGINFHSDASADSKVKSAGKDAIASGNDIFFGKGILESNDAASKGLVAHELAHTMQQGVVESSGVVSESVSAGAEQGGKLTDFFKKLFGKKNVEVSAPTGGQVASDDASLNYMAAMRNRENELAEIKRSKFQGAVSNSAASMAGLGNFNASAPSADKMEAMKVGMPNLRKNSDEQYDKYKNDADVSEKLLVSYALQGFGHRNSREDALIRKEIFGEITGKYRQYMESMDAMGTDFVAANTDYQSVKSDRNAYMYNDYTNVITGDYMKILGSYLLSDESAEYNYEFINGVKDAKVFDKMSPIDYFLNTVLTGEGGRLYEARYGNKSLNDPGAKFTQTGAQEGARNDVLKNAQNNLNMLPIIARMSEDERKVLPASVLNLYNQYIALGKKIEEQISKYQPK